MKKYELMDVQRRACAEALSCLAFGAADDVLPVARLCPDRMKRACVELSPQLSPRAQHCSGPFPGCCRNSGEARAPEDHTKYQCQNCARAAFSATTGSVLDTARGLELLFPAQAVTTITIAAVAKDVRR